MSKKTLKSLKNAFWTIAAVGVFVLMLLNTKNTPLTITIFVSIVLGILFNWLEDKK